MKKPSPAYVFDATDLKKSLTRDARALGIPMGSAEIFIDHVIKSIEKSLKKDPTKSEVDRAVIREMKKYSPDFTYYLQHRNQII